MGQSQVGLSTNQTQKGSFLEQTAIVWKTTMGAVLAWELARLTGSRHPYLAPLTVILCLQATIGQSLRFAFYRTIGTVAGVLMIAAFAKDIPVTAWALGVVLFISTALMKICRLNNLLIHQVALSILFVFYFESHSAGYAWDRAKDTLIGSIVAVVLMILVFPPNDTKKTAQALHTFGQHFAKVADDAAQAVRNSEMAKGHFPLRQNLDALLGELQQIHQALAQSKQWQPVQFRSSSARADKTEHQFNQMQHALVHFVSLSETLQVDMTEEQRIKWSDVLRSIAVAIRNWANDVRMETSDEGSLSRPSMSTQAFIPEVATYETQKLMASIRGNGETH